MFHCTELRNTVILIAPLLHILDMRIACGQLLVLCMAWPCVLANGRACVQLTPTPESAAQVVTGEQIEGYVGV